MQRPSYWLMADPTANPQFRRGWLDPLGHKTERATPWQEAARLSAT